MKRIPSIDLTRGVAMIIMALDHVRDMIHIDSIAQSPTNLASTSPILFFTRWVTYLCAPTFVFLAGTSAFLSLKRSDDSVASRNFLFKRGLYLIALELVVVNLALFFDFGYHTVFFEVIAAIGFGFVVLSLLSHLNAKAIGTIGLLIIFLHNGFSSIPFAEGSLVKAILSPFILFSAYPFLSNHALIIAYPPIPWLGIMLAGYWAATLFERPTGQRKALMLKLGAAALALFAVFRMFNGYGDPVPWSTQKDALFTFLSFMNVTKYPPSLLFCLVTLGLMFLFLAFAEGKDGGWAKAISVYGKVPLFYFLVHFFLIHFILIAILLLQGFSWSQLDFVSGTFGRQKALTSGLPLYSVYILWIAVVAILYKPCKWFGNYKSTHQHWWLRYL